MEKRYRKHQFMVTFFLRSIEPLREEEFSSIGLKETSLLETSLTTFRKGLGQPCFFNHFAVTNVTGFSETLSLARKSLSFADKFLNFGQKGWFLGL